MKLAGEKSARSGAQRLPCSRRVCAVCVRKGGVGVDFLSEKRSAVPFFATQRPLLKIAVCGAEG